MCLILARHEMSYGVVRRGSFKGQSLGVLSHVHWPQAFHSIRGLYFLLHNGLLAGHLISQSYVYHLRMGCLFVITS